MDREIQPIFIMGAPRSGTTMLAGMLSNRDDALALPEMHYIHDLLQKEMIFGYISPKEVFNKLKNHFMFLDLEIVKTKKELQELIERKVKDTIFNIIDLYNKKYFQKNYKIWIEHTPHNHRYFEVLLFHYPNAKFIHIVRDGRAVYSSTKETDWGYKDVITGAIHWRGNVINCLIKERFFKNIVITVKYEDLIFYPQKVIMKICNFLNLDFQESMLTSKGVIKPSFAKFTKKLGEKPHQESYALWENKLSSKEIQHFTAINYDLLTFFGYKTDHIKIKEIKGLEKYLIKIKGKMKTLYFQRFSKRRFRKILKYKKIQ